VGLGRVDLGEQEAGLAAALVTVNVPRHREPRLQNLLRLVTRRLKAEKWDSNEIPLHFPFFLFFFFFLSFF
jgi:hypothetical protein